MTPHEPAAHSGSRFGVRAASTPVFPPSDSCARSASPSRSKTTIGYIGKRRLQRTPPAAVDVPVPDAVRPPRRPRPAPRPGGGERRIASTRSAVGRGARRRRPTAALRQTLLHVGSDPPPRARPALAPLRNRPAPPAPPTRPPPVRPSASPCPPRP